MKTIVLCLLLETGTGTPFYVAIRPTKTLTVCRAIKVYLQFSVIFSKYYDSDY